MDLKQDVVVFCAELAAKLGYHNLRFICQDIQSYEPKKQPHMLLSLHACDTATDYAIYNGYKWGCKIIMAAPCCQHEVNSQLESSNFLYRHGIIKERMASLMTDAIRAEVVRGMGYKCDVLEFIEIENSPKNIMLRAVKTNKERDLSELEEYIAKISINPKLLQLYKNG